jgi:hypothetical protein
MDLQLHENYVYTRQLNLNLQEQIQSATYMYDYICDNFTADVKVHPSAQATMTTELYNKYNYLMYPIPGAHSLYESIKETFHACNKHAGDGQEPNKEYYIQCWLNVYKKDEFIDWHGHWDPKYESWHGFYCVDVEPDSYTTYRVIGRVPEKDDIIIASKNNLLVISKSDGDFHRSSEWKNPDKPRITIAFDIIPACKLLEGNHISKNHWVPI